MLPTASRIRTSAEFASATRRGRRGTSGTLVVHLHCSAREGGARAGFVVSKKVGNSVIRHRVTRRLRPLVQEHLPLLSGGTDVVIRALPSAAHAPSSRLAQDLADALQVAQRAGRRRERR